MTDAESPLIVTRRLTRDQLTPLIVLWRRAAEEKGKLARKPHEITDTYVDECLSKACSHGLPLGLFKGDYLVGFLLCNRPTISAFASVLGDLTMAIDPDYQKQQLGSKLFADFMNIVESEMKDITRIELFCRESNKHAQKIYTRHGFVQEGRLRRRIESLSGDLEDDCIFGWIRATE
eukprot:TRINITY_DN6600_c0_g1_i2.p1 TRINITY_DN6600_c0_g1~~TRINITY_DN6600_c0_g1_i2.p1  ORF type:complete len:177 (-),score=45.00 TRINITY_DN6600_c0_g1_i2:116-646(-)